MKVPVTIQKIATMTIGEGWSVNDREGFLTELADGKIPKLSHYRKLDKINLRNLKRSTKRPTPHHKERIPKHIHPSRLEVKGKGRGT